MKKQFFLAILISFIVLFFANFSFLYYSFFSPLPMHFLGRGVSNDQNTYVYVSFIEQVKQGKTSLENLYTTEKEPVIIAPLYIAIGKAAQAFHLSSISAYHIFRILFSLLLCLSIYCLLCFFFFKAKTRLLAFLFILASSGFGFLFPNNPTSVLSQISLFGVFTNSPALIFSELLLVTGVILYLKYLKSDRFIYFVICAACCITVAFVNSYIALLFALIIVATSITAKISFSRILFITFFTSLGLLYQIMFNGFTLFTSEVQTIVSSPSLVTYFFSFGFLIPLGLFGMEEFIASQDMAKRLILCWIFVNTVLVYMPFFHQEQMVFGLYIPLAIAAVTGVRFLSLRMKKQWFMAVVIFLIILLPLANIFNLIKEFAHIGADTQLSYYYFISNQEYKGLEWLQNNTDPHDVVLSNWFFGNLIPGITGRRVYVGHQVQTENFTSKIEAINIFLLSSDNKKAYEFLKKNGITYIFLGVHDSILEYGFIPNTKPYLKQVYGDRGMSIYKIISIQ